jgi:hypothetical protein
MIDNFDSAYLEANTDACALHVTLTELRRMAIYHT